MHIQALPGNTGYSVQFTGRHFGQGMVDALGRVKGAHYKARPPAIRFQLTLDPDDDQTLRFKCEPCSNEGLLRWELLAIMKELKLIDKDTTTIELESRMGQVSAPHASAQHPT